MRRAVRRAKQVSFRRHRVVVEEPPEESAGDEAADDAHEAEKIEVHVHVHHDRKKSRPTSPARPVLTGVLFDWQWYKEQLSKRPSRGAAGRWSRIKRCQACDATVPPKARVCPRCAAPISRQRIIPAAIALMALGSIVAAFALGVHVLGDSMPEHRAPASVGRWSDDDFVIVEVPARPPSPFTYTDPGSGSGAGPKSSATP